MGPTEIFLRPGEFFFGGGHTRVRTLLGSCVAVTLWHPRRRIGGMCHFMLPSKGPKVAGNDPRPSPFGPLKERPGSSRIGAGEVSLGGSGAVLDGRYADEAMALFAKEIARARTAPQDYEGKLFGGGNMFPRLQRSDGCQNVPCKNVQAARQLARELGFRIVAEHLGGSGHRNLFFNLWSGAVDVTFHGRDMEGAALG